jgi:hypothetical protein
MSPQRSPLDQGASLVPPTLRTTELNRCNIPLTNLRQSVIVFLSHPPQPTDAKKITRQNVNFKSKKVNCIKSCEQPSNDTNTQSNLPSLSTAFNSENSQQSPKKPNFK